MKQRRVAGLVGVLMAGLVACGGTGGVAPAGDGERAGGADPWRYSLDGRVLSPEAVQALEVQHGRLFYLVDRDGPGPVARVFTRETDLERAKGEVQGQGLCVSTRTKTTVYDWEDYRSDHLDLARGTRIADLGSLFQGDGEDWDNDVGSFKAADRVFTSFSTGTNFTGSVWTVKGDNFPDMGGWDNLVSSVIVES